MSEPADTAPAVAQPSTSALPRYLGAAIGAATGPVAAFGQSWAGTGDGRVHVWILATLVGALLGAISYPLFFPRHDGADPAPLGSGFAALFGFSVGLVAGAFAAFPMGAVVGGFGGAFAGAVVVFVAKRLRRRLALGRALALSSISGAGVALLLAWMWLE